MSAGAGHVAMVVQAKAGYSELAAESAWLAAAVAAGYAPHHALDTSAHSQVNILFQASISSLPVRYTISSIYANPVIWVVRYQG